MAETTTTPTAPTKIPLEFQLGDKLIDGATIRPSTYASFADCIAAAHAMTQPAAFSARLLRVRMSRQVAYHVNGSIVQITPPNQPICLYSLHDSAVTAMPISLMLSTSKEMSFWPNANVQ